MIHIVFESLVNHFSKLFLGITLNVTSGALNVKIPNLGMLTPLPILSCRDT